MSPDARAGIVHEYAGLRYCTHPDVYEPADDSFLLVDAVVAQGDLAGRCVVEVGCGAGLAGLAARRQGARVLGVDQNEAALHLFLGNAGLNPGPSAAAVRADLLRGLAWRAVDLLLLNPPYLPTGPDEHLAGGVGLAVAGGASGDGVILRFVDQLATWRSRDRPPPPLILVTSSLNDRVAIHARLAGLGLARIRPLGERRFFFERLFVERFDPA